MGNNEPAVDQSDLRIRGSYGLNIIIYIYINYIYIYIYIIRPSFLSPRPPRYAQT